MLQVAKVKPNVSWAAGNLHKGVFAHQTMNLGTGQCLFRRRDMQIAGW